MQYGAIKQFEPQERSACFEWALMRLTLNHAFALPVSLRMGASLRHPRLVLRSTDSGKIETDKAPAVEETASTLVDTDISVQTALSPIRLMFLEDPIQPRPETFMHSFTERVTTDSREWGEHFCSQLDHGHRVG